MALLDCASWRASRRWRTRGRTILRAIPP